MVPVEKTRYLCRSFHDVILFALQESLEHTFNDFGIDGIISLQEYWNKKIRQVALKLEKESMDLLNEYNAQKVVRTAISTFVSNPWGKLFGAFKLSLYHLQIFYRLLP